MADLLSVPIKKPYEVDIARPLTNVVKSSYSNIGSDKLLKLNDSISKFNQIRNTALFKVSDKNESSLESIYGYYDQLCALESKIMVQDVQVPIKWKDAFAKGSLFGGRVNLTLSSLHYEKVCVLFNIAALQSSVAASQSIETDEGLKLAAKLFQQSSGIFSHLKSVVPMAVKQEPTVDLSQEVLDALSCLMLAQAQEIFIYKAIRDEMKSAVVAKLCCQCEEMYSEALRLLQKESLRNVWEKEWIPIVAGKQAGFHALTMFYQSLVAKANKAVGEEISRLQKAVELFKIASSRSGKISIVEDHSIRAQRNLAEAKKDNDFIYNEMIPDVASLAGPGKALLAKSVPVANTMSRNFIDLFADLVPVALHQALAACESRKAEIINGEIRQIRDATQALNSFLSGYNLPAAIEATEGGSLPPSLVEKAKMVREKGGITLLKTSLDELPMLLSRNKEILDEAERMLSEENASDEQLRQKYKEQWTRTPSEKLTQTFRENCQTYRKIIENALSADKIVRTKFEKSARCIELLSLPENELVSKMPSNVANSGSINSPATQQLRRLMESVETLKAERDAIEAELKAFTIDLKEKFMQALSNDGVINEPDISMREIGKAIAPLKSQIAESITRQGSLMQEITQAQSEFSAQSNKSGSSEESLTSQLASAYDVFSELQTNLQDGTKFYNDLTQLLLTFQNKISDYCFARKTEKDELMKDLSQQASRSAPSVTPSLPAHIASSTAGQAAQPSSASAPAQAVPYPMQLQGMPLPYGATAAAPYPTYAPPPMPQGFNPYATLPYPTAYQGFPQGTNPAFYGTYPGAYSNQQAQPSSNPNQPFNWQT